MTYLSGKSVGEGLVPGLLGRSEGWVPDSTPSDAARMGKGTTLGRCPVTNIGVQGLLYVGGGDSVVPSRGLQGGNY